MANEPNLKCHRCGASKPEKNRYCENCQKAVLQELEHSGYLQKVPRRHERPYDARENTYQTKYGID